MPDYLSSQNTARRNALSYFNYLRSHVHRQGEIRQTLAWLKGSFPNKHRELMRIPPYLDRLWYGGAPLNVIDTFIEKFIRLCHSWELYRKSFLNPN